jgi:hypothetical protein
MRRNAIRTWVMLLVILLLPLLILAAQQTSALLIEGQQGQAGVIQVQGKNYVDVEELARITGGSLRFVGNQIILTLPGSGKTSSQAIQSAPAPPAGFSKPFLSAGIEAMREIVEWHTWLKTAIEHGYPLADESLGNFTRRVQSSLKQADASAITDMDQKALPLLVNEFDNMTALTDEYLKITADREYIEPDSLSRDPLDQKVLACWQSLDSMASSHKLVDDGSCQ